MPLLYVRKEVFVWLEQGKKKVDVRKGKGRRGDFAVFQCGPHILRLKIMRRESGKLNEIVRSDNYRQVIPSAACLEDAIEYFQNLYVTCGGIFTAYHFE